MKIGIFLSTTSENKEKKKYLEAFAQGIKNVGMDNYFLTKEKKYIDCDIAVIFGFYGISCGEIQRNRKLIFKEHTLKNRKKCIFIDADLFKFLGNQKKDENTHVRISYNSIFFDQAIHFNENSDSLRWEMIKKQKQIELKDYRNNGDHILLCLNSNPYIGKGWSAGATDTYKWARDTVAEIRKYSDRKILVRFHPNEKDEGKKNMEIEKYISASKNLPIYFSGGIDVDDSLVIKNTSLIEDCNNAWACITYNSSSSVIPIVSGIPMFTKMINNPTYKISNHDFSKINEPELICRKQWLYDAAYCLWTHEEIKSGIVWNRFRKNLIKNNNKFLKIKR